MQRRELMRYYLLNVYLNRVALAVTLDCVCLIAAAAVTWLTLAPPFPLEGYAAAVGTAALLLFVVLYYTDSYGLLVLGSGRHTLQSVMASMGIVAALAGIVYFAIDTPPRTLAVSAHVAAFYFPFLIAGRLGFRLALSLPRFGERLIIIGTSDLGRALARAIRERRNLGTVAVGFLSDEIDDQGAWIEGVPVLGRVHELEKVIENGQIHRIVVASKSRSEHFPADTLLSAKLAGVRVESGVFFYERVTGRVYMRELRPSYLIFADGFRLSALDRGAKRAIDVLAAVFGLLLASPLLAACAVAIRWDSPGGVFYRQERVGLGGRVFRLWKLRSMSEHPADDPGPLWTSDDDPRITRVGHVLRKARIDELPQLWNVLKGEMSFVGPRPERPVLVDELSQRYPYFRYRCAVKPGITGWAQIRYGYVNDADQCEEKLALDLYYLKHQSLLMDLLILWRTVKTVVLMRGL